MITELLTERLFIKHISQISSEEILEYYKKNKLFFAPTDPAIPANFLTIEFWDNQKSKAIELSNQGKAFRFFIKNKENSCVIGNVSLTEIVRGPLQSCFLGYAIDENNQGKGYMNEALVEVIKFAFENLNLHRIGANHLPDNEKSAKVLKRLGFEVDGVAKKYLLINGKWQDHVLNSLINEKYDEKKNS